MSSSSFRLLFCAVVVAGLAGCGGSSSGGSGGGGGGNNPTIVTYTFNSSANSVPPAVVATQVGAGAYSLATLTSSKLILSIPYGETNFSVAYLCPPEVEGTIPPTQLNYEYINQASTKDGTLFSASCFSAQSTTPTGVATVQVNAAAIPGAAGVAVDGYAMPWSSSTLDFSAAIPAGTYDVPITVSMGEYYNSYDNYLAIKILRSQTIPGALNGGASVVFGTSDEVVPQTITYNNLPAGFFANSPLVLYYTAGGAGILLDLAGPSGQYLSVPSAAVQTGDYYLMSMGAQSLAGALSLGGGTGVGIERYTSSGGPQSVTLPAPWSYAGPTAAALPTFNFVYSGFSGMSNVSQDANVTWGLETASMNEIFMDSTANYQNGSTSMTVPDLSSVSGFLTPPAEGTIYWTADIAQGTLSSTNPPSGTIQYVSNNGTYALP